MAKFVESYLLFQLAAISHSLSGEFYDYLRRQGVNPTRWRLLVNLVDGGMYVSDLVHDTMYEQSRVTKAIDQLSSEGLVERRVDQQDRRRIQVVITEKGRALTLPLIDAAKAHEARILSQLPEDDRETLKKTLAHFVREYFRSDVARPAFTAKKSPEQNAQASVISNL